MRSKMASVAVGLGVFMLVAAALVRFYAYPTLAVVPPDHESVTELESTGAKVFNSDPTVLETETTDLEISSNTVADSGADAPDGVVVWVNSATVKRADGTVFQQTRERAAFDGTDAAGVECASCDTWVEVAAGEREPTTFEGLVYKFPFDTQKKDYPVWDGTTGEAVDATFEGEEEIDGLTVYKFVQSVGEQVVDTREVPGSVFDVDDASVQAEMWYSMTRTFYIEPVTGAPVNRVEDRVQELRYDGAVVPAFTGTVQYTQAQVEELVDEAGSNATLLGGMKVLFPLLLLAVGLALLLGGLFLSRGAQRTERGSHTEDRTLVEV